MEARRRRILERQRQQSQSLRETLSLIHFSTMVLGLMLACGGAYLVTGNISTTEIIGLVGGGTMLALVSFFGWFGAFHEHAGYLATYCGVMVMVLVCQGAGLGFLYLEFQKGGLDQRCSQVWDFFLGHDTLILQDFENMFHCCGYDSAQDRPVPVTCQKGPQGCKVVGLQWMEQWQWTLLTGLVLSMVFQVGLLLANVVTLVMVEKETREEVSEDRLQKQHVIRYGWMINDHEHDYASGSGGRPYYHSPRKTNRRSNPSVPTASPPQHYGSVPLG